MNPTRPLAAGCVVVGRGAGLEPKTIAAGAAGTVLTTATLGAEPAFAAPAAVSLTSGVTGVLPLANGGTGSALGALATLPFTGTAVAAGSTVFLGRDEDATEGNVQFLSPFATTATIVGLSTVAAVAVGVGQTAVYTVRVGGADTALTLTVTNASPFGLAAGAVSVAPSQLFSIKLVTSAGCAVGNHQCLLAIRA